MQRRTYLRTTAGTVVGLGVVSGVGGAQEGNETADGGEGREIIAGTAPGFPPFELREGGELVGFDIDLLEAVVAESEFTFGGWETFEFSSLIPALTAGNIDVIAAAMTITEERDETIDFTDPYFSSDQAVLVREGGEFQPESLEDLAGRPVGAQTGTTGEGEVQQLIEEGTVEERQYNAYGNYVLAVQDLQNGNIDAVVVDQPVAETFADQRPVEIAFVVETGERFGFGVREDDDALTEALNEGLAAVQEASTFDEITNRWFGAPSVEDADNETATGNETGVVPGNETAAGNETGANETAAANETSGGTEPGGGIDYRTAGPGGDQFTGS